jgi:hypothetical protein
LVLSAAFPPCSVCPAGTQHASSLRFARWSLAASPVLAPALLSPVLGFVSPFFGFSFRFSRENKPISVKFLFNFL